MVYVRVTERGTRARDQRHFSYFAVATICNLRRAHGDTAIRDQLRERTSKRRVATKHRHRYTNACLSIIDVIDMGEPRQTSRINNIPSATHVAARIFQPSSPFFLLYSSQRGSDYNRGYATQLPTFRKLIAICGDTGYRVRN